MHLSPVRPSPDALLKRLDERIDGRLYKVGPRWLRRWRVTRFDRHLAAAGEQAVLRVKRA